MPKPTADPSPTNRKSRRDVWSTLAIFAVFTLGFLFLIPTIERRTQRYRLDYAPVDLSFQVVDDSDGRAVPGASVQFIRPESELGQDERIESTESDAQGRARLQIRCRTIGVSSAFRSRVVVAFPFGWFAASAGGYEPAPRVWLISKTGMSREFNDRHPPLIRIPLRRSAPTRTDRSDATLRSRVAGGRPAEPTAKRSRSSETTRLPTGRESGSK